VLRERRPDVAVLIDYPGFNLRFAVSLKNEGVPVVYYISPQVWAWHRGRVRSIKENVRLMLVVFPFEVDIYRQAGVPVEFVGHPLAERIGSTMLREEFFRLHGLDPSRRVLALFPGSRPQEIEHILPVMIRAALEIRDALGVQVAVSVAPNLDHAAVERYIPEGAGVSTVRFHAHDLMQHADVGIVTSGTATLEMGWYGTPMVVVYRTSLTTYLIGRALVRVPFIGLVNIVAGEKIVPELIQHALTPEALRSEVFRLLTDPEAADSMRRQLRVIRERLGAPGASDRVASAVLTAGAAA
jgi:lipid-A-disaccharide synthase